jgi:endonuclease/exonuclease/phosphatase family metal-dependent hydrolase
MLIDRRKLLALGSIGFGALNLAPQALAAQPPAPGRATTRLRVMTYNIRLDTKADGPNQWLHRRTEVSAQIEWFRPDIFGLQEVVFNQKQDMIADLPDYRLVGAGRDDGRDAGESSPIGYRAALFDLLGSGTFWLSPTPDRPSKGWDAAYPRVATWVRLRTRRGSKTLLVINTHWDHIGVEARRQSGLMVSRWLSGNRRKGDHIIMLGDFNSGIGSDGMRALIDEGTAFGLRDSRLASRSKPFGPAGTFNGFKLQPEPGETIDHILVGRNVAVTRYAVIAQNVDGRMLSDHYPVLADLEISPDSRQSAFPPK